METVLVIDDDELILSILADGLRAFAMGCRKREKSGQNP